MNSTKQSTRRGALAVAGLILTIACCLCPAQASAQQWTAATNDSNNIRNTNSGNVGVGTDAPTARLSISEKLRLFDTPLPGGGGDAGYTFATGLRSGLITEAGGKLLTYAINTPQMGERDSTKVGGIFRLDTRTGLGTINGEQSFILLGYPAGTVDNPATRLLVSLQTGMTVLAPSGGNVGIGTATPSHKLHVGGGTVGIQNSASDATLSAFSGVANESATFGWSRSGFAYLQGGVWGGVAKSVVLQGGGGNVSVGTPNPNSSARLHVAGDITADGNIAAKYQDVAEWVPSTQKLAAGTVVILDENKTNHVQASVSSYDTKVAGVVSAQPGVILGQAGEGKLMVATTGRVKVKVDASRASIKVGDLLVTSDVEGIAMKSEPLKVGGRKMHAPGTIIGKALEPLEKGVGEILVLLSLQ